MRQLLSIDFFVLYAFDLQRYNQFVIKSEFPQNFPHHPHRPLFPQGQIFVNQIIGASSGRFITPLAHSLRSPRTLEAKSSRQKTVIETVTTNTFKKF